MPIILSDGTFFGALCAIDPRPARLDTPQTIGMFKLFAELIATHLEAADRLAVTEARRIDAEERGADVGADR
jgi:GAF domain-containing protein